MSDNYFLDTNIFVYTFSRTESEKRNKATDMISRALSSETGMISTQVVQEFINVASREFTKPLNENDCKKYINTVLSPLCEVFPDMDLYFQAIDIQSATGYGFYDSLIICAALKGNCGVLYTEDMQHEQKVLDLKIVNPFI